MLIYMDKNLIYLEIIFLVSVITYLLVPGMLFLKILLMVLTFLFFLKETQNYVYNKSKYMYVGIGFTSILFLFILSDYIMHIYFLVFFICSVVLYLYLYKVLFNTTFGEVTKVSSKEVSFKIIDSFFKTKKEFTLPTTRKISVGDVVILELSKSLISKKPIKILNVVHGNKNI